MEWSGLCEESSELFVPERDRVVIVSMRLFKVISDGRQYSLSHVSQCSVLGLILRMELAK